MLIQQVALVVAALVWELSFDGSVAGAQAIKPDAPKETNAKSSEPADVVQAEGKASELRRFKAHTDWVWSVALTPDGKTLVTSSGAEDHMARAWDLGGGKELNKIDVRGSAQSVVVFPDGRRSAVASADKTIDVWDFVSGKALQQLRGHTGPVFALALIRNGKMLASAGGDGTVRFWDADRGTALRRIEVSDNAVMGLAFSPDDRRILTGDHDSLAKLYDVASGRELVRYTGHTRAVRCVAFVPDASRIVTASEDKSVRLWDDAVRPRAHQLRRGDRYRLRHRGFTQRPPTGRRHGRQEEPSLGRECESAVTHL